ncbi:leucyl aminopeptidase [Vulcanibacillus modesticaldus]|uniref:Probable cytosol aminopeptidase n=1 Tax=Vulcanibacillus modesticaldus TaxID=337097 RepID=A0A1D2YUG2_9BACI|nr:leucyl aminopeptidase [Vulcanibacillus modesticaldus]OEF99348.1 leucyl aminopeptidase [Vulcanibacillus modesticaldus]
MKFEIINKELSAIQTDLLVMGYYEDMDKPSRELAEVDRLLDGAIVDLINQGDITGKLKETTLIHTLGKISIRRILVIGLGSKDKFNYQNVKEVVATAIKKANHLKVKKIVSYLFGKNLPNMTEQEVAHSFAEGAVLANYRFNGYSSNNEERSEVELIQLIVNDSEAIKKGLEYGIAFAKGTNLARDLVNTPGNMMTPTHMADKAIEIARRFGMEYEILEQSDMERLGMGGLLAVARGSKQPPKMIVLKYRGKETWDDVLGLVGKGLTFDSGGISIKPRENMDLMKSDMGGGATVLGVMEVIGRIKPKVNVVAIIPSTENMPSGNAYKPGDVITTMSGKTVEILNTDAEGRLILADGITYAKQLGASRIIDIATLTGAILIALGNVATGAMTNNQKFLTDLMSSAEQTGEKLWQLPLFDEYKEQIKSQIADIKNVGGRMAGSITAALFLESFAENTPWIHLDIAGTAFADKDTALSPKGGTGSMVRSLVQLLLN